MFSSEPSMKVDGDEIPEDEKFSITGYNEFMRYSV